MVCYILAAFALLISLLCCHKTYSTDDSVLVLGSISPKIVASRKLKKIYMVLVNMFAKHISIQLGSEATHGSIFA